MDALLHLSAVQTGFADVEVEGETENFRGSLSTVLYEPLGGDGRRVPGREKASMKIPQPKESLIKKKGGVKGEQKIPLHQAQHEEESARNLGWWEV